MKMKIVQKSTKIILFVLSMLGIPAGDWVSQFSGSSMPKKPISTVSPVDNVIRAQAAKSALKQSHVPQVESKSIALSLVNNDQEIYETSETGFNTPVKAGLDSSIPLQSNACLPKQPMIFAGNPNEDVYGGRPVYNPHNFSHYTDEPVYAPINKQPEAPHKKVTSKFKQSVLYSPRQDTAYYNNDVYDSRDQRGYTDVSRNNRLENQPRAHAPQEVAYIEDTIEVVPAQRAEVSYFNFPEGGGRHVVAPIEPARIIPAYKAGNSNNIMQVPVVEPVARNIVQPQVNYIDQGNDEFGQQDLRNNIPVKPTVPTRNRVAPVLPRSNSVVRPKNTKIDVSRSLMPSAPKPNVPKLPNVALPQKPRVEVPKSEARPKIEVLNRSIEVVRKQPELNRPQVVEQKKFVQAAHVKQPVVFKNSAPKKVVVEQPRIQNINKSPVKKFDTNLITNKEPNFNVQATQPVANQQVNMNQKAFDPAHMQLVTTGQKNLVDNKGLDFSKVNTIIDGLSAVKNKMSGSRVAKTVAAASGALVTYAAYNQNKNNLAIENGQPIMEKQALVASEQPQLKPVIFSKEAINNAISQGLIADDLFAGDSIIKNDNGLVIGILSAAQGDLVPCLLNQDMIKNVSKVFRKAGTKVKKYVLAGETELEMNEMFMIGAGKRELNKVLQDDCMQKLLDMGCQMQDEQVVVDEQMPVAQLMYEPAVETDKSAQDKQEVTPEQAKKIQDMLQAVYGLGMQNTNTPKKSTSSNAQSDAFDWDLLTRKQKKSNNLDILNRGLNKNIGSVNNFGNAYNQNVFRSGTLNKKIVKNTTNPFGNMGGDGQKIKKKIGEKLFETGIEKTGEKFKEWVKDPKTLQSGFKLFRQVVKK